MRTSGKDIGDMNFFVKSNNSVIGSLEGFNQMLSTTTPCFTKSTEQYSKQA